MTGVNYSWLTKFSATHARPLPEKNSVPESGRSIGLNVSRSDQGVLNTRSAYLFRRLETEQVLVAVRKLDDAAKQLQHHAEDR